MWGNPASRRYLQNPVIKPMLPPVDVRHLHAVVTLAEELNFTRAASLLCITQSTLSKQITEIEKQHGFQLFNRDRKRAAELTEAGRAFVEEARSALLHADRAIHLAQETYNGYDQVLFIGNSPHSDQTWVSTLLAIRLPLFPRLKVRLATHFTLELVRRVLAKELHIALVTAPPAHAKLTVVPFAETQLHALLPATHSAAHQRQVKIDDLRSDEWILFPRSVNAAIYDGITETAAKTGIFTRQAHEIITTQQAFHLVSEGAGVAIWPKPGQLDLRAEGVVVRPLCHPSLLFDTCLIMRQDNDSRMVNQFARIFLRRHSRTLQSDRQMELPLSA
jgi:DNA-binding transcriptional LysR family regulator